MASRRIKVVIVACIALLQCLVPLIHAHAHEVGKYHVHIHVDELNASAEPGGMSTIKAPDGESAAIGVTQEFKRDFFWLPILGALVLLFLLSVLPGRYILPALRSRPSNPSSPHHRPPATAPPVRSA
jgi:hypothetical protein